MTVLHTHGRPGQYHPPLPLLAPRGGDDAPGARWEPGPSLPDALRRRQGPWHRLTRRRPTRKTESIHPWVAPGFTPSPNGLVTHVPKGHVPSPSQSVARSGATEVVRPPIAVRRLERYAGVRVTSQYRAPRTERVEHDTGAVEPCRGRRVQPTGPQGLKRLRDEGVQATKTLATVKRSIQAALAKVAGVVQGAVQLSARLTSRQREEPSTGRDPFRCPHGQGERELWCLWHPTYGGIYDEGEVSTRGPSPSTAQRAGP